MSKRGSTLDFKEEAMISTHQTTEACPPKQSHLTKQEGPQDQPYAIIWRNGVELQLFENEDGDFFTA